MAHAPASVADTYFAWYAKKYGLQDSGARDLLEAGGEQVLVTDYPRSIGTPYYLEVSAPGHFLNPAYNGILTCLRDLGYARIVKVTDSLTAGAFTAPFAAGRQLAEERLAQQLPKLQGMMAEIHELLRGLDDTERALGELHESELPGSAGEQAELAMKSRWLDEVEGGAANLSSVIGLAQRVELAELPGLFFSLRRAPLQTPDDPKEITSKNAQLAEVIEALTTNSLLKHTLLQKLLRYIVWKDGLRRTLAGRRQLLVARLRGTYQSLQLQVALLRPALRQLRQYRLVDDVKDYPELAALFGNVASEVELLAAKRVARTGPMAVLSVTLKFVLRPPQPEQRGVPPSASLVIQYRAYAWDDESIQSYLHYRSNQDLDYFAHAGEALSHQLSGIQSEMGKYLADDTQTISIPSSRLAAHRPSEGMLAPLSHAFTCIAAGMRWTIGLVKIQAMSAPRIEEQVRKAVRRDAFLCYKTFKASHGLLTW